MFKNSKKVIANRPCGCKGKGPHARNCNSIATPEPTNNGFNVAASSVTDASQAPQAIKLTDQQILDLFLTATEDENATHTVLTPHLNSEGSYEYMPLYWSPSGATKDGRVNYFNCQNPHNLANNGAVYITRNGGLGINSKFWGGQEPDADTVIFTPIIVCKRSDLV